jgi:hypothetical protein
MITRPATSSIVESQSITDLLQFLSFDTWFIPDLDNTLMESKIELGSDQWFDKSFEHANKNITDKVEAADRMLTLYHEVQHHLLMQPVEASTVWMIRAFQDIGIPEVPLTARSECLIETTQRQLRQIGIDFSRQKHVIPGRIELNKVGDTTSVYQDGIIFCNGQNKGDCLETFVKKCLALELIKMPTHFVMIDDKRKHVEKVAQAAQRMGVAFHGLRYGFLDQKVKQLDMGKAHTQLSELQEKLPPEAQLAITRLNFPAPAPVVNPTTFFAKQAGERPAKRRRLHFSTAGDLNRPGSAPPEMGDDEVKEESGGMRLGNK